MKFYLHAALKCRLLLLMFILKAVPLQSQMVVEVMADQPGVFEITVTGDLFTIADTTLILGEGYVFTGGTEPYSFTWLIDGNPVGYEPVLVIPVPEGDREIKLLVHDAGNCTETVIITHDFTVSVEYPAALPEKISIFPVPATNHITIIPYQSETILDISIFNIQGYLVLKRQISGETMLEIDFPPGIYNVLVEEQNGTVAGTRKIIVL